MTRRPPAPDAAVAVWADGTRAVGCPRYPTAPPAPLSSSLRHGNQTSRRSRQTRRGAESAMTTDATTVLPSPCRVFSWSAPPLRASRCPCSPCVARPSCNAAGRRSRCGRPRAAELLPSSAPEQLTAPGQRPVELKGSHGDSDSSGGRPRWVANAWTALMSGPSTTDRGRGRSAQPRSQSEPRPRVRRGRAHRRGRRRRGRLLALPPTVDHLMIDNPSKFDLAVEVTNEHHDGWMPVGAARRRPRPR